MTKEERNNKNVCSTFKDDESYESSSSSTSSVHSDEEDTRNTMNKDNQSVDEMEEQTKASSSTDSNDASSDLESKKRVKKPKKFDEYYVPESILRKKGIELKFICDATLGRVAKHIRMMGGDAFYDANMNTNYMLYIARTENRIILTKNRTLINQLGYQRKENELKKKKYQERKLLNQQQGRSDALKGDVSRDHEREMEELEKIYREQGLEFNREDFEEFEEIDEEENGNNNLSDDNSYPTDGYVYYFVKGRNFRDMINEVVNFFKIEFDEQRIFTICIQCNHPIYQVEKESIKDSVYSSVYNLYSSFFKCSGCSKIYWGKDHCNEHINFKTAKSFAKIYSYNMDRRETVK
ncbi:hypothetical protein FDP41_006155 [Naegleria fowleri]|uniref:Mut7-C RNAse domain-containing protein n=1 Tax=Naegleria fowleri TaxID=5763 RepID=A0A6A5BJZ0_NAEFO|nr:uncharacterized protein FDP41_006155 [Naegleria fowleri]KAF0974681.1 hypothetical protein FDP41_006155 [Naegleria fowleri]CAG4718501.1 unnamed protein product [Naegleria fowleri]